MKNEAFKNIKRNSGRSDMKIKTFGNEEFSYAGVCKNTHELNGKEMQLKKEGFRIRTDFDGKKFIVYKGGKRVRNIKEW
jgi:hypothetical protein